MVLTFSDLFSNVLSINKNIACILKIFPEVFKLSVKCPDSKKYYYRGLLIQISLKK